MITQNAIHITCGLCLGLRILLATIAFATSTEMAAQTYCQHWISAPLADPTAQIWYRKQVVDDKRIDKAFVSIASTGYADVYVNGRNASRFYLLPYRQQPSTLPKATTYDITRFLKSDTTTIAIWYSPIGSLRPDHHISATVYGTYADGSRFAYPTDGSWLCRQACGSIGEDGCATTDGTMEDYSWKSHSDYSPALWVCAHEDKPPTVHNDDSDQGKAHTISETIAYRSFDACGDTITYDFGTAFYGFLRLTLRNAKRGERIFIGNSMAYTCSGNLDEQATTRFAPSTFRQITICGSNGFHPTHIVGIEGLNISPAYTKPWH